MLRAACGHHSVVSRACNNYDHERRIKSSVQGGEKPPFTTYFRRRKEMDLKQKIEIEIGLLAILIIGSFGCGIGVYRMLLIA